MHAKPPNSHSQTRRPLSFGAALGMAMATYESIWLFELPDSSSSFFPTQSNEERTKRNRLRRSVSLAMIRCSWSRRHRGNCSNHDSQNCGESNQWRDRLECSRRFSFGTGLQSAERRRLRGERVWDRYAFESQSVDGRSIGLRLVSRLPSSTAVRLFGTRPFRCPVG